MDFNHRQESLERLLNEMKELLIAKGHDYGDNEDALSNFKLAELLGLKSYDGVLVNVVIWIIVFMETKNGGKTELNLKQLKLRL